MLLCSFHNVCCKFFHLFTPDSFQCKLILELPCVSWIIFSCWVQTIQVYGAYHVCMLQLIKYKSFWWSNKAVSFVIVCQSQTSFLKISIKKKKTTPKKVIRFQKLFLRLWRSNFNIVFPFNEMEKNLSYVTRDCIEKGLIINVEDPWLRPTKTVCECLFLYSFTLLGNSKCDMVAT